MSSPSEKTPKPTGPKTPEEIARGAQEIKDFRKRTKGMSLDEFFVELEKFTKTDQK